MTITTNRQNRRNARKLFQLLNRHNKIIKPKVRAMTPPRDPVKNNEMTMNKTAVMRKSFVSSDNPLVKKHEIPIGINSA
jgi:hypothetical protein